MEYILSRAPVKFGKDDWLGVKTSPHQPMLFINQVMLGGIHTNKGFRDWRELSKEAIATIYQRLKANEKIPK